VWISIRYFIVGSSSVPVDVRGDDERHGAESTGSAKISTVSSAPVADFVPGRELCAAFHAGVITPLLRDVPHGAALWGTGSDVLGYDTVQSTDHGWGPHVVLFVAEREVELVRRIVDNGLPRTFQGWPIRYGWDEVAIQHHVWVGTLTGWLLGHLGVDPRDGMTTVDWLTIPQQSLLEVTDGPVFADPDGELRRVQRLLAAFPSQVRLWLLACQWDRIGEEEAFVGRAAQAGDELGSRIATARMARELMRVGFLLAGVYWPYTKWFGTAFARLPVADAVAPLLGHAVAATDHPSREAALVGAYEAMATAHNASELTAPVDPTVRPFHERPFRVLGAGRFAAACRAAITDPTLIALPAVGSVDQVVDSTAVLSAIGRARRLRALYATANATLS
jgi:hypothetical protein